MSQLHIASVTFDGFKKLKAVEIPLTGITTVVGGNNAGKSCILQGLHFAITLLARLRQKSDELKQKINNLPVEDILYIPSSDYTKLAYKGRLSETKKLSVSLKLSDNKEFKLTVSRGRNGVFKCDWDSKIKNLIFYQKLNSSTSIFVPGLAGIPLNEAYVSDWHIQKAIARGDANLFLRNILLRIKQNEKIDELNGYLSSVFHNHKINIEFSPENDAYITVFVASDGFLVPLEMVGTGLLQAIQIIAYVTMFKPSFIFLDEPDSHLHPNNQRLLAKLLNILHLSTNVQIIMATHSRHLLEAIKAEAGLNHSIIWMQEGKKVEYSSPDLIPVLMDLGALTDGEKVLNGTFKTVLMTEDSDQDLIRKIISQSGFNLTETMVISYGTSSSLMTVVPHLATLLRGLTPMVSIIVHRDRDYLNDTEIQHLKTKFLEHADFVNLLITEGSDVESKFCNPAHIAEAIGIELSIAQEIVTECLTENLASFGQTWSQRRMGALSEVYRDQSKRPHTGNTPANFTFETAPGKELFSRIKDKLSSRNYDVARLISQTTHLRWAELEALVPSLLNVDPTSVTPPQTHPVTVPQTLTNPGLNPS
jgi:ABC-type uncharacterized transport system ATPase subunit